MDSATEKMPCPEDLGTRRETLNSVTEELPCPVKE